MNPVPEACALLLDPLPYGYDNWSNQFVTQADVVTRDVETPSAASNFDAANRLMIQSSTYDPAGNQTAIGGYTFTYDAENGLKSSKIGEITTTYAYDGEGRRVKKGNEIYVYDAFGNLAAEYGGTPLAEGGPRYLTTDHLGSTRLITKADGAVDQRIDYLPFGKAIPNGVSGRATGQGYQTNSYLDPLKPGFTGKDRDGETGLDYFGARYYAAAQGRFTSADAPFADQLPADPQSWNVYAYARNNPLRFVDPTGQYVCVAMTNAQCDSLDQALQDAQSAANRIGSQYGRNSRQYTDAQRAIDAFGKRGVDNGVAVTLGSVRADAAAQVAVGGNLLPKTADNPTGQNIAITFDPGHFGSTAGTIVLAIVAAHEGSHVADGSEFTASGFSNMANPTQYMTETRAFGVTAAIAEGSGVYTNGFAFGGNPLWQPGWTPSQVQQGIQSFLAAPGLYGYTPKSQGGRAFSKRNKVVR